MAISYRLPKWEAVFSGSSIACKKPILFCILHSYNFSACPALPVKWREWRMRSRDTYRVHLWFIFDLIVFDPGVWTWLDSRFLGNDWCVRSGFPIGGRE